jgi:hypothetical protein
MKALHTELQLIVPLKGTAIQVESRKIILLFALKIRLKK